MAADPWQKVFDVVPGGIALVGPDGRVVRCNPPLYEITGLAAEDLLGSKWLDILERFPGWAETSGYRRALETHEIQVGGVSYNGRTYFSIVTPTQGPDGHPAGVICIISDAIYDRLTAVGDIDDLLAGKSRFDPSAYLALSAIRLAGEIDDDDVFEFVAEETARLAGDAVVVVNEYVAETGHTVVRAVAGDQARIGSAEALLGRSLIGAELELDLSLLGEMRTGRLNQVEGGLHALSFRRWPEDLCRKVEEAAGLSQAWALALVVKGEILGTVTMLAPPGARPEHAGTIEALAYQAASDLQRRSLSKALTQFEEEAEARLAESTELLQVALAAADIGTWQWDDETRSVVLGARFNQVIGGVPAATVYPGGEFKQRIHPDDFAAVAKAAAGAIAQGGPYEAECRLAMPDGTWRWFRSRGKVAHVKASKRLIGAAMDVTDLRRLEAAKDQFLQVLAHELRNPLAAASGLVQLVEGQLTGSERGRFGRPLHLADVELTRLGELIDEIISGYRVSDGRLSLDLAPIDLAKVMRQATAPFTPNPGGRRVRVTLPDRPLPVMGDEGRLVEVLGNLLSNALKYTQPGGQISVWADVEETASERNAVVRVADEGIGIPPDQLEKVFEGFFRATNLTDREPGGLGLGLYISRDIARRHGGDLWAENRKGGGTLMSLRLPIRS